MPQLYILRGKEPVEVGSLEDWYDWFAAAGTRRIIGRTELGRVVIFTAFQGLEERSRPWTTEAPFVFETIVLGGPMNGKRERYNTWRDAELGHRAIVNRVALQVTGPASSTIERGCSSTPWSKSA